MNRNIKLCARAAAIGLLLFAVGCSGGDSETPPPVVPDPGEIGGIQTNLTDPAAVVDAQAQAWQEQNHAAYEALLDDEFTGFFPLAEDTNDFPWMTGDSWDRATELGMASNMFDDNFSQGNYAVDLIEMDTTAESIRSLDDYGRVEVTARNIGRVMWSATDGAAFDTRLVFELVPRDGFLRIQRIEEIPRNLSGRGETTRESASWGSVKALYR